MTASEANKMLGDIRNEEIYPIVYVALYYGLRKSEVLGLKWDAIDFENNTMEIKSTVVKNKTIVYKDNTKTDTSHQIYELLPEVKALLLSIKAKQKANISLYGAVYTPSDYIFTHPDGRLYRPDCVTRSFQRALKRHNIPQMRFHDLRHQYVKYTTKKFSDFFEKIAEFLFPIHKIIFFRFRDGWEAFSKRKVRTSRTFSLNVVIATKIFSV